MAALPDRIRKLRKAAGLTQQQLGDILGVAKNTVSQYETGRNEPNDSIKIAMANHFRVSIDYLVGNTDNPSLDSKTPPVMATQVTSEGIEAIHTYLSLSPENKKKAEDYIKILSQWEKAYLGKGKRRNHSVKEEINNE